MTNKTINYADILGKNIQIISCSNKFNINKSGKIVNETKNMVYFRDSTKDQIIKISKKEIDLYKVNLSGKDYFINGKTLLGRPEEKIAKIK